MSEKNLPTVEDAPLLQEATDGLVVLDPFWRYLYVNDAAARLSGKTPRQLLDRLVFEVHPDFDETIFYKHYKAARETGSPSKFEFYYPHLDRWYTITAYPSQDDIRLFIYFADITPWKRNEEQLRMIVDHLDAHAICMLSPDGAIMTWNSGAEHLFGYTPEEAVGNPLSMLYLKEDADIGMPATDLANALEQRQHASYGWRQRRDGRFWGHHSLSAIRDASGGLVGFTLVVQDRTSAYKVRVALEERTEQLEREKAKAEALLNSIGEGVVATDAKGNVVLVNARASRLIRYDEPEALGHHYSELMRLETEDGEQVDPTQTPLGKTLRTGRAHMSSGEYYCIPRYGPRFPVAITVTPLIEDAKLVGAIKIIRDITREHDADRAKSEFVSLVSHQLRTPLTSMKLLGELLLRDGMGPLTDQQQQIIERMNGSTEKMISLVNALLNVSRIENATLVAHPAPTDLNNLVEEVVAEVRPLARRRQITLRPTYYARNAVVSTDASLLRQVIGNILTNAVQYSSARKPIDIDIKKRGGALVISVRDRGIGIPEDAQARVFARFFRAPAAIKQKPDGTGLGLYLSQMIMQLLGGRIWFKAAPDTGTIFYVSCPTD